MLSWRCPWNTYIDLTEADPPNAQVSELTSKCADDTVVFNFGNDMDDVRLSSQQDMQSISYWMHRNRLGVNVTKSKLMMVQKCNSFKC